MIPNTTPRGLCGHALPGTAAQTYLAFSACVAGSEDPWELLLWVWLFGKGLSCVTVLLPRVEN